jgi:hypothetical protein
MRAVVSALLALALLAGIAGPLAAADDAKTIFGQLKRTRYGGLAGSRWQGGRRGLGASIATS